MKKYDQATQAQESVLDELLELVEVPIPEKLLEDEIDDPQAQPGAPPARPDGPDLAKYLEIQGKTEEEFDAELKEQARARASRPSSSSTSSSTRRSCHVSQEELTEHLMRRAASSGMSPDQFAQAVVEGGQVPMLVGEVARGKALAVVRRGRQGQGHQRRGRRPRGRDEDETGRAAAEAADEADRATRADADEADHEADDDAGTTDEASRRRADRTPGPTLHAPARRPWRRRIARRRVSLALTANSSRCGMACPTSALGSVHEGGESHAGRRHPPPRRRR